MAACSRELYVQKKVYVEQVFIKIIFVLMFIAFIPKHSAMADYVDDFLEQCSSEGAYVYDRSCGGQKFRWQDGPDENTDSIDVCGAKVPVSDFRDYDIMDCDKCRIEGGYIVWGDPTCSKPSQFLKKNVTRKNCGTIIDDDCAKTGYITIKPKRCQDVGKFKASASFYWRATDQSEVFESDNVGTVCGGY